MLVPFDLRTEPIRSLLVCSLRRDPDVAMIEVQRYDDDTHGRGIVVIMYRTDRTVDVYRSRALAVERGAFVLQAGLNRFVETDFERARFDIGDGGVHLDVAFVDADRQRVVCRILESPARHHPVGLLAPVGADIDAPQRLFLPYMARFDFVRRRGTTIDIRIADRVCRPATLPVPVDLHPVYFIRYAGDTTVVILNPDDAPVRTSANGATLHTLEAGSGGRRARLEFNPAFPDLARPGIAPATGAWRLALAGIQLVAGRYDVRSAGPDTAIELDATAGWQPTHLKPSLAAITRAVPSFRSWPSSYRWRGTLSHGAQPQLTGHWSRKR